MIESERLKNRQILKNGEKKEPKIGEIPKDLQTGKEKKNGEKET